VVAPPKAVFAHVEDFDAGMAKAKAEGKAVLVDAWAPWCHTCLSMQNYVLNDPSLASLGERVGAGRAGHRQARERGLPREVFGESLADLLRHRCELR
jgi:thiol-disulfide isomerase/thioredoxin